MKLGFSFVFGNYGIVRKRIPDARRFVRGCVLDTPVQLDHTAFSDCITIFTIMFIKSSSASTDTYLLLLILVLGCISPLRLANADAFQDKNGIGFVRMAFPEEGRDFNVEVFSSATAKSPSNSFTCLPSKYSCGKLDEAAVQATFGLEVYKLDYALIVFRVRQKIGNRLEIGKGRHSVWVSQSRVTPFLTWPDFLHSLYAVDRKEGRQVFYSSPTVSSKKILPSWTPDDDCLTVSAVTGNWIRVTRADFCDAQQMPGFTSGWLQWRDDQRLLIGYSFLC